MVGRPFVSVIEASPLTGWQVSRVTVGQTSNWAVDRGPPVQLLSRRNDDVSVEKKGIEA
jgi:hypothetical protein